MTNAYERFIAPMKEFNELAFKSMERITAVQLKSLQDNAKIGMYALNTAAEVKDYSSLKNYLESQIAVTQYVSDTAKVDVKEINELGKEFAVNAKEVVEKSIIS